MIKNEFILKIEESFNSKIIKQEALTDMVTLLYFNESKIVLKKVNVRTKNIYDFLASQNVENVLYPIKQFVYEKEIFFVYKFINDYEYPSEKKISDLIDVVHELHKKTAFTVRLTDVYFKYFYRIYKNLDRIFQTLEMLIRECETSNKKTDFEWILLSKYHIFISVKKIMYQLQRKIHKYLDNHGNVTYVLNHGNLNLSHFLQKKLVSFDNGYTGIFVSDYAKLYVSLDDIDGVWFKEIDDNLNSYENDFYKIYFKFLVLYIYIINLRINSFNQNVILNTYIQIASKINRFLSLTSNYL
jgi:hypothetical protein